MDRWTALAALCALALLGARAAAPGPAAQPPTIQLRFGDALYDGVQGSYCWGPGPDVAPGGPPVPGVCADRVPPVFETVLAWPAGQPLEFVANGPAPAALALQVYGRPTDPLVLQTDLTPDTSVTWVPTVPPGAYVLAVAARWPQGDVVYYFPVRLQGGEAAPGAEAPPSPTLVSAEGLVGPPLMPGAAVAPTTGPPGAIPPATPTATLARTPTATRTEPPTSVVTPAATPTAAASLPAGRVLLRDDFTDPASGWPREPSEPSLRRLGYADGEYVVATLAGSGGAAFVAHPMRLSDFVAEVDARLVPPTEDAYVFLDFRRQEDGGYYSFLVDPNAQSFLLLRHADGGDARLVDWTPAAAIWAGAATNRLGVQARGPEIALLVNSTEVGRARDATLAAGWLGFGVGSLHDGPAEARFSRLLVTSAE